MNMFLILVVLVIPSRQGDLEQVVHRELITASTATVCQQHADKLADEQREKRAADVQRLRARVVGVCSPMKDPV